VEAGDARDPVASQREHDQTRGPGDVRLRVLEVGPEGRLGVGAGRQQVNTPTSSPGEARSLERSDRHQAPVLVRRGRHGEQRVVGQQGEESVEIRGEERVACVRPIRSPGSGGSRRG
jgi:hypothetical protein